MAQSSIILQDNTINCKPFLRWAGGKRWLLKDLKKYLPNEGYNQYHEPFLGGASIFFHLQPNLSYLSDLNTELIETYQHIKENVNEIIEELSKFKNTEVFYYKIRETKFRSDIKRAARFVFLNQTSFNGIYRVNLKGKYNVPFGYRKKNFFEPENLKLVSNVLSNTNLNNCDFVDTLENIQENDLVFLDPPYTVTHNNNGFIKYNDKLFDLKAQFKLSEYIDEIKRKKAHYILTNAAHIEIENIFKKEGDSMYELKRASLIGGKNAKRGSYSEYIFTNVK